MYVDPAVPSSVLGDATRLRQVVVNLVGNAIKFTERGDVSVKVSAASPTGGRVELVVCVRDTGIGIPADRQDALFNAFVDIEAARRTDGWTSDGRQRSGCRQRVHIRRHARLRCVGASVFH